MDLCWAIEYPQRTELKNLCDVEKGDTVILIKLWHGNSDVCRACTKLMQYETKALFQDVCVSTLT
jgi:hypothetical protein